jgi:hypothetical protein
MSKQRHYILKVLIYCDHKKRLYSRQDLATKYKISTSSVGGALRYVKDLSFEDKMAKLQGIIDQLQLDFKIGCAALILLSGCDGSVNTSTISEMLSPKSRISLSRLIVSKVMRDRLGCTWRQRRSLYPYVNTQNNIILRQRFAQQSPRQ